MTAANIPDTVTKLQQHLASLGDGRDKRSENEQITYRQTYDAVQRCISGLNDLPDQIARVQARLDPFKAQRSAYLEKEQEITKQIASAPDFTAIVDARLRDNEEARQIYLDQRLKLLRSGTLLVAPGVSLGSLDAIDARITELTRRRDQLHSSLDAHVKAAEQILAAAAAATEAATATEAVAATVTS